MKDFYEDVGLGFYKSIDDINNFKLRISIQRTVPASFPINELVKSDNAESLELLQLQKSGKICRAESIFSWQEKVSKEEEKELRSSITLHKSGIEDSDICRVKLFTYVDSEVNSNPQFSSCFQGSSNDFENVRKRNVRSSFNNKTYQRPYVLEERDVVHFNNLRKKLDFAGQSMAVMANIKQNGCDSTELQLCLLHYDSSGTLMVIPDFSKSHYYIRTVDYGTYEFTIENASNSQKIQEIQKEKKFRRKVSERHCQVLRSLVGNQFDMPSSKSLIFHLNGEIVCAKSFSANNIFVCYSFQLPEGMVLMEDESLTGTTHSCKVKFTRGVSKACFGYLFELSAEMELENVEIGKITPVIHMITEVCSVDNWGVCRSLGYGYCDIAVQPGKNQMEMKTWRFLPQTFIGALKEFFIGGIPSIEDLSYIHIPKDHQAKELNKYGTKTEASGTVLVNVHKLIQFGCEASSNDFVHKQEITSNY